MTNVKSDNIISISNISSLDYFESASDDDDENNDNNDIITEEEEIYTDVSFGSVSDEVCRYCLGPVTKDVDFRPCLCTSLVHRDCLDGWASHLRQQNREMTNCQECKSVYNIRIQQDISCIPVKNGILSFLKTHKNNLLFLLIFLVIPFLGKYGNYFISEAEYTCMNGNYQQVLYSLTILSGLGMFVSTVSVFVVLLAFWLVVYLKSAIVRVPHFYLLFGVELLIYVIGNATVSHILPISWSGNNCVVYNMIQKDRVQWIYPNIGFGTWFLGFNFICIFCVGVAVIIFVFGCIPTLIWKLSLWCIDKCGYVCCCPCLVQQRIVIENRV
uniref:RING-CH-type domain-containing protein n=1 Tax=viral metagenome TaxID=1070528 RepID=A0A6C0JT85_9ZZZZ